MKCQISWVVNYVAEPAANRFADLWTQLQWIQVPLAIFSVPLEIYTLSMHSMTAKFVGRKKIRIKKSWNSLLHIVITTLCFAQVFSL